MRPLWIFLLRAGKEPPVQGAGESWASPRGPAGGRAMLSDWHLSSRAALGRVPEKLLGSGVTQGTYQCPAVPKSTEMPRGH